MSDLVLKLKLTADSTGVVTGVKVAETSVEKFGSTAKDAGTKAADGLGKARAGVQSISAQLQRLQSLAGAWAALAGARAVIGDLVRTSDAMASINARLRLVTSGAESFAKAQASVRDIAFSTSTGLESVATLYTRLSQSSKSLGLSQEKVADLTKAVSIAVRLSGGSAESAAAGVMQLSQAFASGVLSGDEFRSVMENSPRLVQALTDSLGVSVGQLRQLAEGQKLSASIVAEAILLQKQKLESELKSFPSTVGAAMTQVQNAWMIYVDSVNSATGETASLAGVLHGVSDLLQRYGVEAKNGAGATEFLAQGVRIAAVFFSALKNSVELLTNVFFGLWDVQVAVVRGGIDVFSTGLNTLVEFDTRLRKLDFKGAAQSLVDGQAKVVATAHDASSQVSAAWESMKTGVKDSVSDVADVFEALNTDYHQNADQAAGAAKANAEYEKQLKALQERAKALLAGLGPKGASQAVEELEKAWKRLADVGSKLAGDVGGPYEKAWQKYETSVREVAEAGAEVIRRHGDLVTVQKMVAAAVERAQESLGKEIAKLKELGDVATPILEKLQREADEAALTDRQRYIKNAVDAVSDAYDRLDESVKKVAPSLDQQKASVAAAAGSLYDLAEASKAAERAAENEQRVWADFATGINRAFEDAEQHGIKGFLKAIGNLVVQTLLKIGELRVINPFLNSLFNLNGTSSALPVGAGGGFGGLFSGIASLFGGSSAASASTVAGGGLTGYGSSAAAVAAGSGGSTSFFGGLVSSVAHIPVAGWIAAAILANASFATSGWTMGGGSTKLPDGQVVHGGGVNGFGVLPSLLTLGGSMFSSIFDRSFRALGLSNTLASILSGGGLITRLFGHQAPRLTGSTVTGSFGADGVNTTALYNILEKGGLFASDKKYSRAGAASAEAIQAMNDLFAAIKDVIKRDAAALMIDAPKMIDAAIRVVSEYDKKGKVTSTKYFVDVLGKHYEEQTAELAQLRLTAEAEIATIGKSAGDASTIAEQWRGSAEKLSEGAALMLAAQRDIVHGVGLLGGQGSLGGVVTLVQQLHVAGESLSDTYARLVDSTHLLEQALALSGVTLDKTRVEFVTFAAEIADAAGGLDQARTLWAAYFDTFYSASERADAALAQAQQQRDVALTGLGGGVDASNFRARFEAALPTLKPEEVVTWLRAAEAIQAVQTAEAELTKQREAQLAAMQGYAAFITGINRQIDDLSSSDFQRTIRGLGDSFRENTARANELAIAAGLQGAREEDLARIHQLAAMSAAKAAAELEAQTRDLIAQLYGPAVNADSAFSSLASSVQSAADAANSFRDSALLDSNLSPLNAAKQYQEALRQLRATGDEGVGRRALELARGLYSSGADYRQQFDLVTGLVRPASDSGTSISSSDASGGSQLSALQRMTMAQQLAQNVADLSGFSGESFSDLAGRLGLNLGSLSSDLGIKGDQLDGYLRSLQASNYDPTTDIDAGSQAIVDALHELLRPAVSYGADVIDPREIRNGNPVKGVPPATAEPAAPPAAASPGAQPMTEGTGQQLAALLQRLIDRGDSNAQAIAKTIAGAGDDTEAAVAGVADGQRDLVRTIGGLVDAAIPRNARTPTTI